MLDLADEDEAIKVAEKLARETGRCVTVRDATSVLSKPFLQLGSISVVTTLGGGSDRRAGG